MVVTVHPSPRSDSPNGTEHRPDRWEQCRCLHRDHKR